MPNETLSSSFPATQQDISNLKQTATDAVNDLSSTATTHASKVKGQLKQLAGDVKDEGAQHIDRVKASLGNVVETAREYAAERPFACIGIALAVGFFLGLSRRGGNSD